MTEFNPEIHESFVSRRLQEHRLLIARVALFDELIDMHHDGYCTFDEAMTQYHHDTADLLERSDPPSSDSSVH